MGQSWINKDTISNHQIKPIGFKMEWKDIYCMACCGWHRRSGWRAYWRSSLVCSLTRKPEVLSRRQRKRTVKLRSSRCSRSGWRVSWRLSPADSAGRKEFHISCLWSSSRSSECTNSYTDWCTMSDCNMQITSKKLSSTRVVITSSSKC